MDEKSPESHCSSKETLDMQSSKHQRNGFRKNHKTYQNNEYTLTRVKTGNKFNSDKNRPQGYLKNRPKLAKR